MKYSNFTLWRLYWLNYKDRGIVLPIAIGLGLIAVLVGTIMLTRSFRDQTNVMASQLATKSESFAELGVTRFLDLINQNRAIASVNACSNWNLQSGICQDSGTTTASWYTVGNPVTNNTSIRLSTLIDDVTNPATILSTNLTPLTDADIPSCSPSTVDTTTITSLVNQLWQSSSNNEGQYRLIDYRYDGGDPKNTDDGEGILTVEGGVGQAVGNNNKTETAGTGITRLEVRFPVELKSPWGLWTAGGVTASAGVKVDADVRDSRCGQSAAGINDFRRNIQGNNRSYIITKKNQGSTVNFSLKNNVDSFLLPKSLSSLSPALSRITTTTQLTRGGKFKYAGTQSSPSINLTGTDKLTVDAPGQTVEIYLMGSLVLTGQASIEVTRGTRFIIYASSLTNIQISGNPRLINNNDTPDGFQIYVYGNTDPLWRPTQFTVSGGTLQNVFIFAPFADLSQTGSSAITGTMWAKSWSGTGTSQFTQASQPPDLDKLAIVTNPTDSLRSLATPGQPILTLEDISVNKIKNISSWQRLPVPR